MDNLRAQQDLLQYIRDVKETITPVDDGSDTSLQQTFTQNPNSGTHYFSQIKDCFFDNEGTLPSITLATFSFEHELTTNNYTTVRISLYYPTSDSTSNNPSSQLVKEPKSLLFFVNEPVTLINKMTEPRARAARHKGQMNFEVELKQMLYAFGDDVDPLDETVRVLDEIVTDFIIETSHTAAKAAEVSGRTKLKVDDFKFAIRKDEVATGRVKELLAADKNIKSTKKVFDDTEGRIGLERGGRKKKKEEAGSEVGSVKKNEKGKGKELPVADDEELGDEDDIDE